MEKIRVSVIIPTYNHEKYIAQAIESVLNQKTDFKYEIIVGDDASTDRTPEIIRKYEKLYFDIIKVFIRTENLGASRNGFELSKQARGEYIACCEGDDFWTDTHKLQKQADFLDNNHDFSACTHDVTVSDAKGDIVSVNPKIRWISKKRVYSIGGFNGEFLPGHPSSLFRRNYIKENGFDYSDIYKLNNMISDRTIALIWASFGKIYRLPDKMASYRIIRDSKADNVTSGLYLKNDSCFNIKQDFIYTVKLERFAERKLKQCVNTDYHKASLYASCIFAKFIHPNNKRELQNLRRIILKSCRRKTYCVFMFPIIVLKRTAEHLTKIYK